MTSEPPPLTAAAIEEARHVIDPVFLDTPQYADPELSRRLGTEVVVKVETLNPLRSFKGRGASYLFAGPAPRGRVVCASAGNFGQAIAYAGARRRVPVLVYVAHTANPTKVDRMRALGSEVIHAGGDFDEAKEIARAATGAADVFVEDGADPRITVGAGTIGAELGAAGADTVLVPVGNGALASGVGCWLKERSPGTRVVGVCAEQAPAMARSWERGSAVRTEAAATMADGIAVRVPVPAAVAWTRAYLDDMWLVGEDDLLAALALVRDTLGLLLEPSGAATVAAVLRHRPRGRVAAVLTGANAGPELLGRLAAPA